MPRSTPQRPLALWLFVGLWFVVAFIVAAEMSTRAFGQNDPIDPLTAGVTLVAFSAALLILAFAR